MAVTTDGIPYPTLDDPANVPADIQALAEWLQTKGFTPPGLGNQATEAGATLATSIDDRTPFAELGLQAGVDDTGTTECAAAIQTALDGMLALGVRAHAKGTFKIGSTVTIAGNADLGDATFDYTGTSGTAIVIGSTTSGTAVSRIAVVAPKVVATAKTVTGWAEVAGTIGVDISNLYSSTVHIPHVQNFETNHRTYGKGTGCVYNTITLGHLDNGKINHLCDASATGWCNENLFICGRFSHDSGEGTDVSGARQIQIAVTTNPIDNNLWLKPSLEGNVPEFHASIGGVANTIFQGRWEATTPKVRWDSNAADNKIRGGYNAGSIVETWVSGAAGTNDIEGHLRSYFTRSGGTKGAWIEETTSSANDPIRVGMDPGARVGGADPATAYRYQFGATYYRGKRATDANPRFQIDHTNGRLYFGNGTAALGAYMYGTASIFILNGGGLSFEADNTYDIGGASLRPRDIKLGRNLIIGGALDHDGTTVGFYGATPATKPTALTAANAGAINSGDATTDAVIANLRTRIGELEAKLQSLGLLT